MGLVWAPARVGDAHASATGLAGCGAASRCAILRRAAEAIRFGSLARAGRLRAITPVVPVISRRDEHAGGFCMPVIRPNKIEKIGFYSARLGRERLGVAGQGGAWTRLGKGSLL